MKTVKKGLRLLFMIFVLLLASFGIGLMGIMNSNREAYLNNEIRIEQVSRKEDEEGEEGEEELKP